MANLWLSCLALLLPIRFSVSEEKEEEQSQIHTNLLSPFPHMMWYIGQALSLLSMFKLGYYLKIPERPMFWGQMWGTAIVPLVNYGVTRLVLDNIDHAMLKGIKHSVSWNALGTKAWYSASILWVCLGQLAWVTIPTLIVLDDVFFTNLLCNKWYRGWLVREECLALVCFFFPLSLLFLSVYYYIQYTQQLQCAKKKHTDIQATKQDPNTTSSTTEFSSASSSSFSPTISNAGCPTSKRNTTSTLQFFSSHSVKSPLHQWHLFSRALLPLLSCEYFFYTRHEISLLTFGILVVVWDIFFDVIRFGGQIITIYLLWLLLAGWLFKGLWWLLRLICRGLTFRTLSRFFFSSLFVYCPDRDRERKREVSPTLLTPICVIEIGGAIIQIIQIVAFHRRINCRLRCRCKWGMSE